MDHDYCTLAGAADSDSLGQRRTAGVGEGVAVDSSLAGVTTVLGIDLPFKEKCELKGPMKACIRKTRVTAGKAQK